MIDVSCIVEKLGATDSKQRLRGAEDCVSVIALWEDEAAPDWPSLVAPLTACLRDSNAKVAGAALQCLEALVRLVNAAARPYLANVVAAVAEHCLGNAKAPIRDAGISLLVATSEKGGFSAASQLEALKPFFSHRNQRVRESLFTLLARLAPFLDATEGKKQVLASLATAGTSDPSDSVRALAINATASVISALGSPFCASLERAGMRQASLAAALAQSSSGAAASAPATLREESSVAESADSGSNNSGRAADQLTNAAAARFARSGRSNGRRAGAAATAAAAADFDALDPVPVTLISSERDVHLAIEAAKNGLAHPTDWRQWVAALQGLAGAAIGGSGQFDDVICSAARATLHEAVAKRITDLRSAVAKEACRCVAVMARHTGKSFAPLAALWLTPLVRNTSVAKEVIAASSDAAARAVISATGVGSREMLRPIMDGVKNKTTAVRRACVSYLQLALLMWTDSDAAFCSGSNSAASEASDIGAVVAVSVTDSDENVRAAGRRLYWVLRTRFPATADAVWNKLDPVRQRHLNAELAKFDVDAEFKAAQSERERPHAVTLPPPPLPAAPPAAAAVRPSSFVAHNAAAAAAGTVAAARAGFSVQQRSTPFSTTAGASAMAAAAAVAAGEAAGAAAGVADHAAPNDMPAVRGSSAANEAQATSATAAAATERAAEAGAVAPDAAAAATNSDFPRPRPDPKARAARRMSMGAPGRVSAAAACGFFPQAASAFGPNSAAAADANGGASEGLSAFRRSLAASDYSAAVFSAAAAAATPLSSTQNGFSAASAAGGTAALGDGIVPRPGAQRVVRFPPSVSVQRFAIPGDGNANAAAAAALNGAAGPMRVPRPAIRRENSASSGGSGVMEQAVGGASAGSSGGAAGPVQEATSAAEENHFFLGVGNSAAASGVANAAAAVALRVARAPSDANVAPEADQARRRLQAQRRLEELLSRASHSHWATRLEATAGMLQLFDTVTSRNSETLGVTAVSDLAAAAAAGSGQAAELLRRWEAALSKRIADGHYKVVICALEVLLALLQQQQPAAAGGATANNITNSSSSNGSAGLQDHHQQGPAPTNDNAASAAAVPAAAMSAFMPAPRLPALLLPVFARLGDPKEAVRTAAVAVLDALRRVYPAPQLCAVLLPRLSELPSDRAKAGLLEFALVLAPHSAGYLANPAQQRSLVLKLGALLVTRNNGGGYANHQDEGTSAAAAVKLLAALHRLDARSLVAAVAALPHDVGIAVRCALGAVAPDLDRRIALYLRAGPLEPSREAGDYLHQPALQQQQERQQQQQLQHRRKVSAVPSGSGEAPADAAASPFRAEVVRFASPEMPQVARANGAAPAEFARERSERLSPANSHAATAALSLAGHPDAQQQQSDGNGVKTPRRLPLQALSANTPNSCVAVKQQKPLLLAAATPETSAFPGHKKSPGSITNGLTGFGNGQIQGPSKAAGNECAAVDAAAANAATAVEILTGLALTSSRQRKASALKALRRLADGGADAHFWDRYFGQFLTALLDGAAPQNNSDQTLNLAVSSVAEPPTPTSSSATSAFDKQELLSAKYLQALRCLIAKRPSLFRADTEMAVCRLLECAGRRRCRTLPRGRTQNSGGLGPSGGGNCSGAAEVARLEVSAALAALMGVLDPARCLACLLLYMKPPQQLLVDKDGLEAAAAEFGENNVEASSSPGNGTAASSNALSAAAADVRCEALRALGVLTPRLSSPVLLEALRGRTLVPALQAALLDSGDLLARQLAVAAAVEMYQVLGEALLPFLAHLPKVRLKLITIYIDRRQQQGSQAIAS